MAMKLALVLKPRAARLACCSRPFMGLHEGVGAVIEHAAHDALEVLLERGAQTLE